MRDISVFIRRVIMRFHRCSAVRAGHMHADNINASAVFACFLIHEVRVADFCPAVIFLSNRMKVHGKHHDSEKNKIKDQQAGTSRHGQIFIHDMRCQVFKGFRNSFVHAVLFIQEKTVKIFRERIRLLSPLCACTYRHL